MERTQESQPKWTSGTTTHGTGYACDDRSAPTDGHEQFLTIFQRACSYFESQGIHHMDAQDLAVEAYLRWMAQVDQGRRACTAWFRQVTRNLLVDHCRRRGREQLLLESYAGELRSAAEENHWPEEWCVETLADLPPSDREILFGHYVEGLKVKELACRLVLSANCVKQRLHRARERLHSLLVGHQSFDSFTPVSPSACEKRL